MNQIVTISRATFIPKQEILKAQACGTRLLQNAGIQVEPVETALAVEEHRWAWRPDVPPVILIAESRVFTSADDLALSIVPNQLPQELRHLPTSFVRLIYCLGYGGKSLLSGIPACGNPGTPQFWKIFGRIAGTGSYSSQPSDAARLEWKVQTLKILRARGDWLLDASFHAIYAPQKCARAKLSSEIRIKLHQTWWQEYGALTLNQVTNPYVCVIGKTTADTLAMLGVRFDNWIYQPQAARGKSIDMEYGWSDLLAALPTA